MCRRFAVFAVFLLLPAVARAQFASCSPGGACGTGTVHQVARSNDSGQIELWYTATYQVCEMVTKTVEQEIDGQVVQKEVAYTVCKPVQSVGMSLVDSGEVKAYGTDRKRIPVDKLPELLAEPTPVLVCNHNQKIDGTYLKLVKPGTIVLLLPPPQPAVMMAAPAPIGVAAAPPPPPAEGEVAPAPPAPPAEAENAPAPPAPIGDAPAPPIEGEGPVAAPAPAGLADAPELPAGTAPHASLAVLDGGTLKLRQTLASGGEKTAYRRTADENGNESLVPVSIKESSRTETTQELDGEAIQGFTVTGEEIPADELASRLSKETPVLISGDGRAIDPGYLGIIRDDAILLVVPVVEPPIPMPVMPVPAAPAPAPADGEAAPPPPAA